MSEHSTRFPVFPRAVRPAPEPLGLFLRVSRTDQRDLLNLIAAGDAACFGAVFDPTLVKPQAELLHQILEGRLDAILDPRTQASAMPGGYTDSLGALPWGIGRPHTPSDFTGTGGRRIVAALGNFVLEHGFTQVLSPTHLLRSARDEWLDIDLESADRLRAYLDRNGGSAVPIIYSLAITYAMLRDAEQRHELIDTVRTAPASAIWLKVDNFGSDSSATAIRTYINAARDFHELGVPIVADHAGGLLGLSLLAFGAAGGITHGITQGERFSSAHLRRPRGDGGFGMPKRIYLPQLDLLLKPNVAKALLDMSPRVKAMYGCRDTHCCPRGTSDMLSNPARHFLCQRIKEISGLSQIPEQLRAQRFLEQHVRPASDAAVFATGITWTDEAMGRKMQEQRKRLESMRVALGEHALSQAPQSFARLPRLRAAREGAQPI